MPSNNQFIKYTKMRQQKQNILSRFFVMIMSLSGGNDAVLELFQNEAFNCKQLKIKYSIKWQQKSFVQLYYDNGLIK